MLVIEIDPKTRTINTNYVRKHHAFEDIRELIGARLAEFVALPMLSERLGEHILLIDEEGRLYPPKYADCWHIPGLTPYPMVGRGYIVGSDGETGDLKAVSPEVESFMTKLACVQWYDRAEADAMLEKIQAEQVEALRQQGYNVTEFPGGFITSLD